MLTAERARELLDYNPLTGVFRWRVTSVNRQIGDIAGSVNIEGYREIGADNRLFRANRLAWLYVRGEWPSGRLDHENRDRDDNRFANLREATAAQNAANRKALRADMPKGVFKKKNRYVAGIKIAGKRKHLGSFKSPEEAHAAYCVAANEAWGSFAYTGMAPELIRLER